MKKIFSILAFVSITLSAYSDVIYFPYQYSLLSYSAELIYSTEKVNRDNKSTVLWAGIGGVGSFFHLNQPTLGIELAIEKRHYFKPKDFEHFFISGYIGTAYMTNFKDISDIGIVPGIKINYKSQLAQKIVLEPYISVSLPISYNISDQSLYVPFPVATIGVRFGLCTLQKDIGKTENQ
jgi:hypothetical protein